MLIQKKSFMSIYSQSCLSNSVLSPMYNRKQYSTFQSVRLSTEFIQRVLLLQCLFHNDDVMVKRGGDEAEQIFLSI
jgi:hypothetical protein